MLRKWLMEKWPEDFISVQAVVRHGPMPYSAIADATRYMRKPRTHDGWEAALEDCAHLYRKALWASSDIEVEIWLEKSALAGVLYPVTAEYDVPLMPTGGYTSETFAHVAAVEFLEKLRPQSGLNRPGFPGEHLAQ